MNITENTSQKRRSRLLLSERRTFGHGTAPNCGLREVYTRLKELVHTWLRSTV